MTSKERVKAVAAFQPVDRVATQWSILPGGIARHGDKLAEILREFPDDFGSGGPGFQGWGDYQLPPDYKIGTWTDGWGITWEMAQDGVIGIPVGHPLAEDAAFDTYQFPPAPNVDDVRKSAEGICASNPQHFVGAGGGNVFERMQFLRGYEKMMMEIALDEPMVYRLRDMVTDYFKACTDPWMEYECIDGAGFADDWGTQRGLIIHPDKWRQFFKPAYTRLMASCVKAGKVAMFHTDGFTWDVVPDFVEAGVRVLNPQHTIMGHARWAATYRGLVAIRTDLDRQHILPHGTPAEMRAHVKDVIDNLGTLEGGLIMHGEVAHDVPLDNIRAMAEAFAEFGTRDYLNSLPAREESPGFALRDKLEIP
jgi:hypothetical protein